MKILDWDEHKNELLKQTRNISFEEAVFHINNGDILDIIEHPNSLKYPNQEILIIEIQDYACFVPYVENEDAVILKTIILSRKYTKKYLKK